MATKLLLIDDVDDLGRSGDIVSVKPGYARNFLLPQGFAVAADKRALRMQAQLQEERRKRAVVDKQESDKTASQLEGVVLTEIVKVDQEGHMYGSVSALDVARMLQEKHNVSLEKKSVQLKHAIKETGVHTITIKLKEGVTASIKLKVISETDHHKEQQEAAAQPKTE
jgi:large subunit ribosomal protein L9